MLCRSGRLIGFLRDYVEIGPSAIDENLSLSRDRVVVYQPSGRWFQANATLRIWIWRERIVGMEADGASPVDQRDVAIGW